MTMPRVTSDLIASIREQTLRCDSPDQEPYCSVIMREMKEENPEMYHAITSSVRIICERMDLDLTDRKDYIHMVNILNLAASVYQSIKQQLIVDELESSCYERS